MLHPAAEPLVERIGILHSLRRQFLNEMCIRDSYTGSMVCSKQLFKEALGHTYDEPKRWQLHNINELSLIHIS